MDRGPRTIPRLDAWGRVGCDSTTGPNEIRQKRRYVTRDTVRARYNSHVTFVCCFFLHCYNTDRAFRRGAKVDRASSPHGSSKEVAAAVAAAAIRTYRWPSRVRRFSQSVRGIRRSTSTRFAHNARLFTCCARRWGRGVRPAWSRGCCWPYARGRWAEDRRRRFWTRWVRFSLDFFF